MNRIGMSNLALLMAYKMSPREIDKLVDRLGIAPSGNLALIASEDVRVAAVQLMCKQYASLADYIVDMNLYLADAVNRRAQLVCFPAYTGALPATLLSQLVAELPKLYPQAETGLPDVVKLNELLSYFSDICFDTYYHTMSALAARYGVYLMAGSALYYDDAELRHRAFLFSDTGNLVGFQDKISLNALEQALEIEPADELKVFDTPLGAIAIMICEDADYSEIARIAKNLGAQILIAPTIFTREQTPADMALGINMRAQETLLYGVQSTLVGGTGLGFTAEGAAGVFFPNELLTRKNGVHAQTSGRFEPDIVCSRLNLDKLIDLENPYVQDKNPELIKKYLDRLY